MKVLYINTSSSDYVQDLTYSGLVKKFGKKNILDYKWNPKYHIPYKKYPKNLGYVNGSFFSFFRSIDFKHIDYVFLSSSKIESFETYLEVAPKIPSDVPVIFIDGGDSEEIGQDLEVYGASNLYDKALSIRPFDFIFKREFFEDKTYDSNVAPLPMSFNFDRLPKISQHYKYDVSFWAVESHPLRTELLKKIEEKYDCYENGTTRNQKFSRYKRKGSFYLKELADCKITINVRGAGWDTMRYWEVPAVGGFMLSQKPKIVIPNNFENEKEVVFFKDDLTDLDDLCEYYLKNDLKREAIAKAGLRKMREHHTDEKRIEYIFEKLDKKISRC
ncbi:glycosyltransferase family protein [Marinomonas shanghaiensis]|uniref:glycosyltransferase family protein n=1 Tax=Marinomonas shanghaiensis TaxID=2202418 RepID=UPI003A8CA4E1